MQPAITNDHTAESALQTVYKLLLAKQAQAAAEKRAAEQSQTESKTDETTKK